MLIAHSSGTTARPKQVPITHRMQLAAARARNRARDLTTHDVGLLVAPSFTVMHLTNVVTMLVAGGATICPCRLEPLACLRANATLQPTWIHATPPFFNAMLQHRREHPDLFSNARLRQVIWGSAPANHSLAMRLEQAFGVPSDTTYGMTEASAIAMPAAPGASRPGSVGVAASVEIRIIDAAGQPLPTGARGEVVIRGEPVFSGYLDDPEASAAAFTLDGWFHTGDVGYVDDDGFLLMRCWAKIWSPRWCGDPG
jgi:acyl-CoA synthetase (AMP-forming)/AMP-acid ligase II